MLSVLRRIASALEPAQGPEDKRRISYTGPNGVTIDLRGPATEITGAGRTPEYLNAMQRAMGRRPDVEPFTENRGQMGVAFQGPPAPRPAPMQAPAQTVPVPPALARLSTAVAHKPPVLADDVRNYEQTGDPTAFANIYKADPKLAMAMQRQRTGQQGKMAYLTSLRNAIHEEHAAGLSAADKRLDKILTARKLGRDETFSHEKDMAALRHFYELDSQGIALRAAAERQGKGFEYGTSLSNYQQLYKTWENLYKERTAIAEKLDVAEADNKDAQRLMERYGELSGDEKNPGLIEKARDAAEIAHARHMEQYGGVQSPTLAGAPVNPAVPPAPTSQPASRPATQPASQPARQTVSYDDIPAGEVYIAPDGTMRRKR